MAPPFLQAACLPPVREGAQTVRRVRRVFSSAQSPLIIPTTPARLPLRWFNTASVTSRRTPRRCSPVARVRRRSCSHQPETPDAVSSADFAFDYLLNGVPRSPGKTRPASRAPVVGCMAARAGGRIKPPPAPEHGATDMRLDDHFGSGPTLQRNERVKLAASCHHVLSD